MKSKILTGLVLVLTVSLVGCTYDQIEPARGEAIDPDIPTSFATDIQPIFTAKCISCHPPTANLDLSEGIAYGQITQSKYMDLGNPSQSLIYTYPNPTSGTHSYRKYTTTEANLLLKWIEEGALDN